MNANRNRFVRRLKAAAVVGVFGLVGGSLASNANAALITFDMVATGGSGVVVSNGGKTVTVNSGAVNPTVTVELDALFPNTDNNQGNDGLTQAVGSVVSNFGGGGSLTGTFVAQLVPAFQGLGASPGAPVAGTPTGSTNVGSDTAYGTASTDGTQFQADSSNSGSPQLGPTGVSGVFRETFGTATFSISSSGAGSTVLQFIPHTTSASGVASHIQQFTSDGTATFVNGNNANVALNGGVTVSAVPEPGSLALLGLGGLGLLRRRRAM